MPVQPLVSTTQHHLSLADIKDDLVILKTGAAVMVLQLSAVNFGLLSEPEQDAIIYAYAALLNSLSFPIQILIRSQKKDISSYLQLLKDQQQHQKDPAHRDQIDQYRQFVESLVKQSNILDKKFYVVIPFSALELGLTHAAAATVNLFKPVKNPSHLPFPKDYIITRAKTNLEPKRDHLLRQFNRLGLRAHQLTTKELIELFFILYNPDSPGVKLADTADYTQPLVQPALAAAAQPTPPVAQTPPIPIRQNVPSQT